MVLKPVKILPFVLYSAYSTSCGSTKYFMNKKPTQKQLVQAFGVDDDEVFDVVRIEKGFEVYLL